MSQSDTDFRVRKGTRRLHLASGEIWRVADAGAQAGPVSIVREGDGESRTVARDYWLGDSWGRPRSRMGAARR